MCLMAEFAARAAVLVAMAVLLRGLFLLSMEMLDRLEISGPAKWIMGTVGLPLLPWILIVRRRRYGPGLVVMLHWIAFMAVAVMGIAATMIAEKLC